MLLLLLLTVKLSYPVLVTIQWYDCHSTILTHFSVNLRDLKLAASLSWGTTLPVQKREGKSESIILDSH